MSAAVLTPSGVLSTRERMWQAIRELGVGGSTFTIWDIAKKAGIDRHKYSMCDYLKALVMAGYLGRKLSKHFENSVFTLLRDTGIDAPRVRKNGELIPDNAQTRIWRAMKCLKRFNYVDVQLTASLPGERIKLSSVKSYFLWLSRAGYIRACAGEKDIYRFINDTGPKAPQILRIKQLYDPNTGKVLGDNLVEALDAADK